MTNRMLAAALLLALLGSGCEATPSSPAAIGNFAGSWSGAVVDPGEPTEEYPGCSGPAIATIAQSGSAVSGTLSATSSACRYDFVFQGAADGNTFRGSILESVEFPISGSLSGDALSLTVSNSYFRPLHFWELHR